MLEYGESYLKGNAFWLRRARLRCQLNDNLAVYYLAKQMAEELEDN